MPPVPKTIGPGWRCDACGYSLQGLPDRAEQIQCPECGHTARPVGATPIPSAAGMVLSALVSLGSLAAAGYALWFAHMSRGADLSAPEAIALQLTALTVAAGLVFLSVVIWFVPSGRWPIVRWVGAIVPAALAAVSAWSLLRWGGLFSLAALAYGVGATSLLVHPELERWLRRKAPRASSRR
jgi:hypothetical protein